MNRLTPTDLAYIAGFFDGDGSVIVDKYHAMWIAITNTNKTTLDWLMASIGGNIYRDKRINKNQSRRWQWRLCGKNAASFLVSIIPYLRIKKEQAALAIEFQGYVGRLGVRLDEETKSIRGKIAQEISNLKRCIYV